MGCSWAPFLSLPSPFPPPERTFNATSVEKTVKEAYPVVQKPNRGVGGFGKSGRKRMGGDGEWRGAWILYINEVFFNLA